MSPTTLPAPAPPDAEGDDAGASPTPAPRPDVLWIHGGAGAAGIAEALAPFGLGVALAAGEQAAREVLDTGSSRLAGVVIGPDVPRTARERLLQALRRHWPWLPAGALVPQGGLREVDGLAAALGAIHPDRDADPSAVLSTALQHYARRWRLKLLGYGSRGGSPRDVMAAYLRDARIRLRGGDLEVPVDTRIARRIRDVLEADPDAALATVHALIEVDPVLAGRLVALANSTAFGGRTQVHHPGPALVRVGATGLLGMFDPADLQPSPQDPEVERALAAERARAARVARLARAIAAETQPDGTSDLAHFCGLVMRVGRLPARIVLSPGRVPVGARAELADEAARARHEDAAEQAFTLALFARWQLGAAFERLTLAARNPAARVPLSPAGVCALRADTLVQVRDEGHEDLEDLPDRLRARMDCLGLLDQPKERLGRWLDLAGEGASPEDPPA